MLQVMSKSVQLFVVTDSRRGSCRSKEPQCRQCKWVRNLLHPHVSQILRFSNRAFLKCSNSQIQHFSNSTFLKWSNSQIEHFSNGAILKWSNSQMQHFGVATLCHISRSQEQRNMACDVLDLDPIKINDGNETKETMMMMMLLRTKMAKMAMLLRRW